MGRATCPDGGTCHHGCAHAGECFRVRYCGPLSPYTGWDEVPMKVLSVWLCEDTGINAVTPDGRPSPSGGVCPVHHGDRCIARYDRYGMEDREIDQ